MAYRKDILTVQQMLAGPGPRCPHHPGRRLMSLFIIMVWKVQLVSRAPLANRPQLRELLASMTVEMLWLGGRRIHELPDTFRESFSAQSAFLALLLRSAHY